MLNEMTVEMFVALVDALCKARSFSFSMSSAKYVNGNYFLLCLICTVDAIVCGLHRGMR